MATLIDRKPWLHLPKVPLIQEHLDQFYQFVYERHMVWFRRFVLKLSPPWTANRWLRDYKFTNVYRELDRGTAWLMSHILSPTALAAGSQHNLLWQVVLYRVLNRVETFEAVGIPSYSKWEADKGVFRSNLYEYKRRHGHVFTSAHLTVPVNRLGGDKLAAYLKGLDALHKLVPKLWMEIAAAETMEQVFRALQLVPYVGPFIAYEITVDLTYGKLIPFTEDDFVNAGPGCKVGIKLIFPERSKKDELVAAIHELRDSQQYHFQRLSLDFPYLNGKPLSLRNIEHSLCEFCKMWKITHGVGKARMLFKPKSTNPYESAAGQLPLSF